MWAVLLFRVCVAAMSKFSTTVTGCTGNVVVGDNAVLTIGATSTDGKMFRFSQKSHAFVEYFTSGFFAEWFGCFQGKLKNLTYYRLQEILFNAFNFF